MSPLQASAVFQTPGVWLVNVIEPHPLIGWSCDILYHCQSELLYIRDCLRNTLYWRTVQGPWSQLVRGQGPLHPAGSIVRVLPHLWCTHHHSTCRRNNSGSISFLDLFETFLLYTAVVANISRSKKKKINRPIICRFRDLYFLFLWVFVQDVYKNHQLHLWVLFSVL